ncbi:unnamed protein product [Orchesella dallaii]|uniref:C2H2-type domain-containing protein n=1 Tax=Orchesella dallaii TaxID=48710 RepID=A0ABP1QIA0_9HEXA
MASKECECEQDEDSENQNIFVDISQTTSNEMKSAKDSDRKKSKRKKRTNKKAHKESTEKSFKSSPLPSTSSSSLVVPVPLNEVANDDIAIKTESDAEMKEEGCDIYFEIDSATCDNEELLAEALSQIEEKVLTDEINLDELSVRNIVFLVENNLEDGDDSEIKSEPPSPNEDDNNYCGDGEEIEAQNADIRQDQDETPSTSCSLRKALHLRKEGRVPKESRSSKAAANESHIKTLSLVTKQTKRKQSKRSLNPQPEALVPRVGTDVTVLEIDAASSSNSSSDKVATSTEEVPASLFDHSGNVDILPSMPLPLETHQKQSESTSPVQPVRCNEDAAEVGEPEPEQTLLQEMEMLSPSSIKVEVEQEVDDEICSSSLFNDSNEMDSNEVEERLSPEKTSTHITKNITDDHDDTFLTPNIGADSLMNTVAVDHQSQPQCNIKMNLRRNRKPTFKILSMSNWKSHSPDNTDTCEAPAGPEPPPPQQQQQQAETFEKRGRGRPRKHPIIDPTMKEPKKMGRPKIIRTEEEIEKIRKQKNSQRALKKRMHNQLLREQRQLAKKEALQKLENRRKSYEKVKKPRRNHRQVLRPHPLELYQQAHHDHITVSSQDLMSIFQNQGQDPVSQEELESFLEKTAFSVGHGTFENPHFKLLDEDKVYLGLLTICPGCGETFKDVEALSLHKQASHPEICPTCEVCGKPVIKPCGMIRHKKRHFNLDELNACYHQEVEKFGAPPPSRNDRLYKCSHCSKILIGWVTMNIHEKIHTEAYSTSCPICSKPIYRKDYLKYHMTTHLGLDEKMKIWKERRAKKAPRLRRVNGVSTISSRNYPSSDINSQRDILMTTYSIDDKTIYLQEVKIESSPEKMIKTESACQRPVDCLMCGKTFRTVYTLKKHQWTMHSNRSNENPFRTTCPICSRPFERGEYLSKHVQTHMNEKEKQLFLMWSGSWRQFLESFKGGSDIEELPEPRKHRGRPKIQRQIVKVPKKKGRPKKISSVQSSFELQGEGESPV